MTTSICENCKIKFIRYSYAKKSCSRECQSILHSKALKGKMPKNIVALNANKKGPGNPQWGKPTSQKQKELASINAKKMWADPIRVAEIKKKMSEAQLGEKGSNWRGDDVRYSGLHKRFIKIHGKAFRCDYPSCKYPRKAPHGKLLLAPKSFQWANLDHQYRMNKEDWMMMCASCHLLYDKKFLKGVRTKL